MVFFVFSKTILKNMEKTFDFLKEKTENNKIMFFVFSKTVLEKSFQKHVLSNGLKTLSLRRL